MNRSRLEKLNKIRQHKNNVIKNDISVSRIDIDNMNNASMINENEAIPPRQNYQTSRFKALDHDILAPVEFDGDSENLSKNKNTEKNSKNSHNDSPNNSKQHKSTPNIHEDIDYCQTFKGHDGYDSTAILFTEPDSRKNEYVPRSQNKSFDLAKEVTNLSMRSNSKSKTPRNLSSSRLNTQQNEKFIQVCYIILLTKIYKKF